MKRPFVAALIIGLLVAGAIGALHATQLLARVELPAREFISLHGTFNQVLSERWQYIFLSILSVGVAWMTSDDSAPRAVGLARARVGR